MKPQPEVRTNVAILSDTHRRLKEHADRHNMSLTKFLEAIMLMPNEEIDEHMKRVEDQLGENKRLKQEARAAFTEKLNSMSPDEIRKLVEIMSAV